MIHWTGSLFSWGGPTRKDQTIVCNKKVLLHERKRHTDHGVSSTPSRVTQGRVPLGKGTPLARSDRGYLRWGTPQPGLMGIPKVGYLPGQTWLGYPPPIWTWPGYPPTGVDRQMNRHVSKHNFPVVLRMRSVKMMASPLVHVQKERSMTMDWLTYHPVIEWVAMTCSGCSTSHCR